MLHHVILPFHTSHACKIQHNPTGSAEISKPHEAFSPYFNPFCQKSPCNALFFFRWATIKPAPLNTLKRVKMPHSGQIPPKARISYFIITPQQEQRKT